MKNFIVYLADGKIVRTGSCSDSDFNLQPLVGELVIEGQANDATEMIKDGLIVNKPPAPIPAFDIDSAREIKSKDISFSCEMFITSGFNSGGLGATYMYPSNRDDQLNLSGTIQRSSMPGVVPTDAFPFLCKSATNVWDYLQHTPAQIQQVGKDAYAHILNARVKNATLQGQINAATTQAELNAIVW